MPQNHGNCSYIRISRYIITIILLFVFFAEGYTNNEEIHDKTFFASEEADVSVHDVVEWIVSSGDNKEMPFLIIDKKQAKIYVFMKEGLILAAAPALIGQAIGDYSFPGVGDKKLSDIKPNERTTPAGKFLAKRGLNADGTEVIWIDFDAAIAIHPSDNPKRLQHLRSRSSKDKRSTLGCINVTKEFYMKVISPLFAHGNGFVYILPETMPVNDFFKLPSNQNG